MARPGFYTGSKNDLPVGCIVSLFIAFGLFALASIAFEIWWKWTLISAVLKYLHG